MELLVVTVMMVVGWYEARTELLLREYVEFL